MMTSDQRHQGPQVHNLGRDRDHGGEDGSDRVIDLVALRPPVESAVTVQDGEIRLAGRQLFRSSKE